MNINGTSSSRRGVTLSELMIVILILIPALLITILIFVRCLEFIELSRNTSRALGELKNKCNQIELTEFGQIASTFHQVSFQSASLTGRGITYVETLQPDLLRITASYSWREKSGRIIGEDKDFDGAMDVGEDTNGNGFLDSPVEIVTLIHHL